MAFSKLLMSVRGCKNILIMTHDHPDPDGIASAAALQYILRNLLKARVMLAYSGVIGRAENRAMINNLKIKLTPLEKVDMTRERCFILVDTQPGTGNNSIPDNVVPVAVIDHHRTRNRTRKSPFYDVRDSYGASSTIVAEYLFESGLPVRSNMATALIYGITSETQDLGRKAIRADIDAYTRLFPRANKKLLSQIERQRVSKEYFIFLGRAIGNAFVYRNAICSRLGEVPSPDIIPQMADLLIHLERMTWAIALGFYGDQLIFSVRTTNTKAKAGKLAEKLVKEKSGTAGGHDMLAAGQIRVTVDERERVERAILEKFMRLIGHTEFSGLSSLSPLVPAGGGNKR